MDVQSYMHGVGRAARSASRLIAKADTDTKNRALRAMADALERASAKLLDANALDIEAAHKRKLEPALIDRLTLTRKGVTAMADGLAQIAALPDPIGEISNLRYRPSGIQVGQMRVPLGVVGIIYESRPNVTADAAGLCLKAGNAAILRGGSEALHSNQAIAACVHEGLRAAGLPESAVQVIETTDRAAVGELVTMREFVDVIVPRGGKGLIERLERESRIPMIKHLHGVCHVYIDDKADLGKALRVADNAKTQRLGTCNTMETLLVARGIARDVLPPLCEIYREKGIELRGDDQRTRARSRDEIRHGRRLVYRVSRGHSVDTRRGRSHPGARAHRALRLAAHRRDRHRGFDARPALPAGGRFELRHGERLDTLRRWIRIRIGRRDRNFDGQAARAWAGRSGRSHVAQVGRHRRWTYPAMSKLVEVKVPDIGDFHDIPVIEVLVKAGDAIKPEDTLVTLESDKATMEVPSPAAGVVKNLSVKVGDKVSEGTLLLTLDSDQQQEAPAQRSGRGRRRCSAGKSAEHAGKVTADTSRLPPLASRFVTRNASRFPRVNSRREGRHPR